MPQSVRSPSTPADTEWWRIAVIYQIYPRSFADSDGDGIGDLAGVTAHLDELAELGIDAIWLSPFFTSPQRDAGYDVSDYRDVDPLFGNLADADRLVAEAHARGIRVIADIVPNHSSSDHPWFVAALAAKPGSPERARYMFREGRGANGDLPPNNWESVFGGPAWTRVIEADGQPGQWYLHLFDASQPDFNWENPAVRAEFLDVLRFWLDRGIDGFRVDVAHGLIKAEGLPDWLPPDKTHSMGRLPDGTVSEQAPYWAQEGVHEVYREWRQLFNSYPGERILAAEAWVDPLAKMANWVRADEMHQAFNFGYLMSDWDAQKLRDIIDESTEAFAAVGAPPTWVLSNHDVIRHATRLSLGPGHLQGHGIGPKSTGLPEPLAGLQRARAATALMLALPGSAYIYQGEELGLPEAIDLPDDARQDPTWFRTHGARYGRDGCRVPLPWTPDGPSMGFGASADTWLPQPEAYRRYARSLQRGVAGSTLSMYQLALKLRRDFGLGAGELRWLDGFGEDVVAFANRGVRIVANTGSRSVPLPEGEVLLASGPVNADLLGGLPSGARELPADVTVWLR